MPLRLEKISKSFEGRPILKGIDCEFPAGEISTVLGVSGSGKTTLLRIIAGLEQPETGRVVFEGQDITNKPPAARNMGFVFQDLALYSHLSVERNLSLPLQARGITGSSARERIAGFAAEFGLSSQLKQISGKLSGGEGQRLALARALIRAPSAMLLDEPFSHLDAPLQRGARRFVFSMLREKKTTAVLVTHNHQDAQEAGGTVFFVEEGQIRQRGSWEDLYRMPESPTIARTVSFFDPIEIRGRVVSEDGEVRLLSSNPTVTITLDISGQEKVGHPEKSVLVIIRPEDLTISDTGEATNVDWLHGIVIERGRYGFAEFYRLRHKSGLVFSARAGSRSLAVGSPAAVSLRNVTKMLFPDFAEA